MRFVFTSCLVPFSIAIMGHRSDSELFIYVAATMSWIDVYGRSDRLRYVQTHCPARSENHGYCRWISTPQSLLRLQNSVVTQRRYHPIHLHVNFSVLWIAYRLEVWWTLSERMLYPTHLYFTKPNFQIKQVCCWSQWCLEGVLRILHSLQWLK